MRFTAVIVVFVGAGCFNPRISDGGFACNPEERVPCPEGFFCRDVGAGYVCKTTPGRDTPSGTQPEVDLAMPPAGAADMAMPPAGAVDMAMPPASCGVADLVINEVQTGGANASDEFIEVYNPCGSSVTVTGSLVYRATAGKTDIKLADVAGKTLAKQGYFLAGSGKYAASADVAFNGGTGLSDSGGGVALLDGNGKTINAMGWGDASNAFVQGTAASASNASDSMARQPNGVNTHDDKADFRVAATPTPRASN